MPITADHAGRHYPPTPAYEVSAAKIAEFADALGDDDPRYRGPDAEAPPTFAAVIAAQAWQAMFTDPELGLALHRIVHADQRFEFARPLRAGDQVRASLTIDRVRSRGGADMISTTVRMEAPTGDLLGTVSATLVHNHGPAEQAA